MSRSGMTMMDVVISVMIMGIMTAVTAPKFMEMLSRTRVDAAASRIQHDLAYARQTAISTSATMTVQFTPISDDYLIPGLVDLDRPGQTYKVTLSDAPYESTLLSATLGGDTDVIFDRYGKPDSGGVITVQSGAYQQTVTLDPETGRATIP